jgi:drug/metabolite transporter (DMT)-like permease
VKIVGNIIAAILIFFGVLFIWGAFSDTGQPSWLIVGVISAGIGLGIVWFVNRKLVDPGEQKVTLDIDLSGDVDLEKFQCSNCGGNLSSEHVHMVAGAPTVDCPYCGVTYQITEKPKW